MAVEIFLKLVGIAVPALLITIVVKRWVAEVEWRVALLFFLLAVGFLGKAAVTADLPIPVDDVMRGYPFRGVVGEVQPQNPLVSETARQMLPWMEAAREELFSFRAPLWNRYSFSGYPLLGNGQSAPFSPFFLATLFVPLPAQIVAMGGLKIFMSLLFGYLFLRRENLSAGASIIGSCIFSFSVFQTVYLFFPITAVSALLPAALFATGWALDHPGRRSFFTLGIVTAAVVAGGHPESVFHTAIACGSLVVIERLAPRTPKKWMPAAATIILALVWAAVLAAPAWAPVAEQILESSRFGEIGDKGMVQAFPTRTAAVLSDPDLWGNPVHGTWKGLLNYCIVAPTYFGLLPLALLAVALLSWQSEIRDRLYLGIAAVFFLLAMNWGSPAQWLNTIPPLQWVANDRLRFVAVFFVAVLAARTLDRWRRPDVLLAGLGSVSALLLFAWVHNQELRTIAVSYRIAGCVSIVGFWVVVLLHRWRSGGWDRRAAALAASLIVMELFVFNLPFNAVASRSFYAPRLPIVDALHEYTGDEGPFRVVGLRWFLLPNVSAHYGLEDIRGSDPMALAEYQEFFRLVQADNPEFFIKRVRKPNQPGLDFLNVRFVMAKPGSQYGPPLELIYDGPDGVLYENPKALPRFYAPRKIGARGSGPLLDQLRHIKNFRREVIVDDQTDVSQVDNGRVQNIKIHSHRPDRFRLRIETKENAFIASSQPWSPGWRAMVNDVALPIRKVNGAFIGFEVEVGKTEVKLQYRPASFFGGLWASGIAVLVGFGLVLGSIWRRPTRPRYRPTQSHL